MITISCIFLPHIRALAVIIFKSVGYDIDHDRLCYDASNPEYA
ncbi:hypothetical protein [Symbiopectobacterium sp. RP]